MSFPPGHLPNLIVIGAQKCATSSLHYYLSLHPEVCMSREKELNFFAADRNWLRGLDWYQANFTGQAKIYGESSPEYTNYPQQTGVAARIASVLPGAKLIYIVRDPIERIVSHYVHLYARNLEDRPIEQALESLSHNPYLYRSRYFMQLEQYLDQFPARNILLLTTEALLGERAATLQQVFKFLDIEDQFYAARFGLLYHQSHYKRRKTALGRRVEQALGARLEKSLPPAWRWYVRWFLYWPLSRPIPRPVLGESLRQKLAEALRPDIDQLRTYTGQSFANWSV